MKKKKQENKLIKLKNVMPSEINVQSVSRQPGEVFEAIEREDSFELANLIKLKYLELDTNEANDNEHS